MLGRLTLNTQLYQGDHSDRRAPESCGCTQQVVNFGIFTLEQQPRVGRTIGFWRNNNGVPIIVNGGFWDELAALNLVDGSGNAFNPTGNVTAWKNWLQGANAGEHGLHAVGAAGRDAAQRAVRRRRRQCLGQHLARPMQIGAVMAAANARAGRGQLHPRRVTRTAPARSS